MPNSNIVIPPEPQGNRGTRWDPPTLHEWLKWAIELPDPAYFIEDFVPADEVVAIAGQPKRGHKTWFAMTLALVAASGREMFGIKPTNGPLPVLFIELEGGAKAAAQRFYSIARALGVADDDPLWKNVTFSHRDQLILDDAIWQQNIMEVMSHDQTKIVFVDTFAQSHRGDENSSKDIQNVMRAVTALRDVPSRPTFIFLHHVRKAPSTGKGAFDALDSMRGSSAFGGAVGHIINFYKKKDDQRHLDCHVVARNDQEKEFVCEWAIEQDKDRNPTKASFSYAEVGAGKPLPENIRNEYLMPLTPGEWYSVKGLVAVWNLSSHGDATRMASMLVSGGDLEKDEKRARYRLGE